MKTCSDCKFCKINISQKTLRCSKGGWSGGKGKEKIFIVSKNEVQENGIKIYPRDTFKEALRCPNFEDMR